jgi:asparagine synthase (glutamine-hydrolysing)
MCGAIIHRGPDDEGYYCDGQVGLGMRRLQVIDLPGGHQPMTNEDGSLRIVFNGEIYNYQGLRQGLMARGHTLQSHSDTETILHLYEEKGIDCLQDLRGMFAFALWDQKRQELVIGRDRLGKKPLYYSLTDGGISFASELAALLQDRQVKRAVDPQAVDEYLTYLFVPHPKTIFRDVCQLPPASYAVFSAAGLKITRYWDVAYTPVAMAQDTTDKLERLDALLRWGPF